MSNSKSFLNVGEKRRRSGGTFRRDRDGDVVMGDPIEDLRRSIAIQEAERERVRAYMRSDEWKAEKARLVAQQEAVVAKLNTSPNDAFFRQQWMALNAQLNAPMKQLERLNQEIQQDKAQLGQLRRPSDPNQPTWTEVAAWTAHQDEKTPCIIRDNNSTWIQTGTNRLFVRPCYKDLYDIISCDVQNNPSTIAFVEGTPGIGKSCFLDYALWRLLGEGKTVLYIYGKEDYCYVFRPDRNSMKYLDPISQVMRSGIAKGCDYVLFDPPEQGADSDKMLTKGGLRGKPCIVALLPAEENCKALRKDAAGRGLGYYFFMGPFSWEEVMGWKDCCRQDLDQATLGERFGKLGGVPRYLGSNQNDFEQRLKQRNGALNDAAENPLQFAAGSIAPKFKEMWSLYHLRPVNDPAGSPYRDYDIDLCCDDACTLLRNVLMRLALDKLWGLYEKTDNRLGTLRGIRYEAYAHKKLMAGYDATATGLVQNGIGQTTLQVAIPPDVRKVVLHNNDVEGKLRDAAVAARTNGAYLLPHLSNFPVVDSVYVPRTQGPVILFQMKAGRTKPLSGDKAEAIFQSVGQDANLVFVVPHATFLTKAVKYAQPHGPRKLKQYLLVLHEPL